MKTMTFSAVLNPEDGGYISLCPELDIASQGETIDDALANLKEVSKLPFNDVRTLIQEHYDFRFENLDGWPELLELREIVNSLKHRRGRKSWKRHRKTGWPKNLLERDDLDFDKAAKAIKDVGRFLIALECVVASPAGPG